jgi:hypothetical protein
MRKMDKKRRIMWEVTEKNGKNGIRKNGLGFG